MADYSWVRGFPGAITTCSPEGVILDMNDAAVKMFEKRGGKDLVGTNLLDCHPEPARTKLQTLLETRQANVYTMEKEGVKKLIYHTPWYENGEYRGFVALALEIPFDMPHFVRGV